MKTLVGIVRIFVGIFFMVSGFVKMVDPVGFSFKLQEYFGPGVFNLDFLVPYSLAIAIILVIFEFVLGVMLIVGYVPKFTRWALLLLILFFTFLTFYSAYFNKVTDCGCFGDAMPLTPWQSFSKDVVLLILILIIFFNGRYLKPLIGRAANKWIVFVVFIGCLGLSYNVLMHLPAIDFRPYKVGANIQEGMMPKDGDIPSIHDFALFQDGKDKTDEILNKKKVLLITSYNMDYSEAKGWEAAKKAAAQAEENGYEVIGLTASGYDTIDKIKDEYGLGFDFILLDETTIKTIVRSNPGMLILHKGTVMQKTHWNDADELTFN